MSDVTPTQPPVDTPVRSAEEIKKELDYYSKEIGKTYHQLKCCEHTIEGLTNRFNSILLEFSKSEHNKEAGNAKIALV